jgi:DeoR family glycerol-3-phosphate regulon repressor
VAAQPSAKTLPADRHARIVELMQQNGLASVEALADTLGVSLATVRRDLNQLENQGLLNRVHGGASLGVTSFASRSQSHVAEKTRIAVAAAAMCTSGEALAFDGGTTVLAVVSHLQASDVAIVTNSVDVVVGAQGRPGVRVIVSGGTYDPVTHAMYGSLTEAFYREHRVDRLFIGAGSLSAEGLRDSNVDAVAAKRGAIHAAREVVVVADSSKFGLNALALVAAWDQIDWLISDACSDPAVVAAAERSGVQVLTA